ncbi:XRE family transcriptional regulator [Arsenicitalea aurantiaca]|uniref:XRE family transcriptional regulator n=2 Tax=Arsenicitalea aurantiaca TaxID=1783274 RepID=A0A433X8Q3_9HYPH|nr:helix-turn-helix transcriptional regulator [Arsenicitalea aurantiaca]RUT30408.1 XRE family transcriptional regulator [Arsenicitalea aurantiaca]
MNVRLKLAINLRRLRVERGLSQERLAADAGVDRTFVGGIERQSENPSIDVLDRLAAALSVEVDTLLQTPAGDEIPANLKVGRKPRN